MKVKPVQAKDKTWSSGVCVDKVSPRSYKVKVGGNIYRRNRIQQYLHNLSKKKHHSSEPIK